MQNTSPVLIQNDELNSNIGSLSEKQRERQLFNLVHDWAKKSLKMILIGTGDS